MQDILDRLELWRKERGLDISQGFEFDLKTQCSFVFEEIGVEFLRAKTKEDEIDALCDSIVFQINALSLLHNGLFDLKKNWKCVSFDLFESGSFIDILFRIISSLRFFNTYINPNFVNNIIDAKNLITREGYDFYKCMEETLKEIESRKGAFNPDTKKWEKFKDEESMKLWYKADYSKCKF